MDRSEVFSLHFINFCNKYKVLQRKKLYFLQKYLESQMHIHQNYMQIMENYRKITECLNSFKYECTNPSRDIFVRRVVHRSVWRFERKSNFWEDEVPKLSDEKFKKVFRLTRNSFKKLCEKLHFLKREDTNQRKAIPLEKRIAIALYALGSFREYRTISHLFGVGRTTVGNMVVEFCTAVCNSLEEIYVNSYPPTEEKINEIVSGFQNFGLPQCYGVIDGCHIKMTPLREESTKFYNSKGWHSVILFASVDHKCRFTYISANTPGQSNDSQIFENSTLKKNHEMSSIFKEKYKMLENTKIPIFLIGDSAFPLSNLLMTPFPRRLNQSADEKKFNYTLLKTRSVIETAFDQLKARFRKLTKGLEVRFENSTTIITACCILHNFLSEENDNVCSSWLNCLKETENIQGNKQPEDVGTEENNDKEGKAIRKALTNFLCK